jgi:hypothetical protein
MFESPAIEPFGDICDACKVNLTVRLKQPHEVVELHRI